MSGATPFFKIQAKDSTTNARAGLITTAHGDIETPIFLPVGTAATVKSISPVELRNAGAQIVLSNTYHLSQQPGSEIVRLGGGLAKYMGWGGPTLTDSGGFQVFSLSATRKVTEDGVKFQSVYDGKILDLTPESTLKIERDIGADIIYALDECAPFPADYNHVKRATEVTTRWAARFMKSWHDTHEDSGWFQAPFLVMQGGMYDDLRRQSAEELSELNSPGFGIGGLSVGEPHDEMIRVADLSCRILPQDRPRHLMGVGTPMDILEAIEVGVDMFDCVIPTRNGRNGQVFTSQGVLNLRNTHYKTDQQPIDPICQGECCQLYTRSYIHHLTISGEILGARILSLHNITYYLKLVREARTSILSDNFSHWCRRIRDGWQNTA